MGDHEENRRRQVTYRPCPRDRAGRRTCSGPATPSRQLPPRPDAAALRSYAFRGRSRAQSRTGCLTAYRLRGWRCALNSRTARGPRSTTGSLCDLSGAEPGVSIDPELMPTARVSALKGTGLTELEEATVECVMRGQTACEDAFMARRRHLDAPERGLTAPDRARGSSVCGSCRRARRRGASRSAGRARRPHLRRRHPPPPRPQRLQAQTQRRIDAKEESFIDPSRSLNGIIEPPRRFAPTGDRLHRNTHADDSGWDVVPEPALEAFPIGDDLADVERLNTVLEAQIGRCIEQYLWIHRRFKSRPPGAPQVYHAALLGNRTRRG